jgi:O-antigen/teichoic acid export membrane protein
MSDRSDAGRIREEGFGTETKNDFRSAGANVGIRGLTLASKFLLVIVLARYFSPEDLGVYGLMVSSIVIGLFVLGLEYKYFTVRALIARTPGTEATIVRDQAVLYLLVAAVVLPLLVILSSLGAWSPIPSNALPWFFVLVVVELAAQESGNALLGLSRPLAANLVLFVRSGLWVYLLIILAVTIPGARTVATVFIAWVVGAVASTVLAAWYLRGIGWGAAMSQPVDWAGIRAGLRISAPFLATSGAALGLLYVDRFIIQAYHGLEPVGVYTFFVGITTALHTLVNTGVSLVRMPRLVRAHQDGDIPRFRHELRDLARATILTAAVVAVLIAAGILPILWIVGRAVYLGNLGVFFLLLAAASIRCLADPALYALYARHQDLRLLGASAVAFAVSVIANFALVPALGISGAAIAAAAGAFALLAVAVVFVMRGGARIDQADAKDALSAPMLT